MTSTFTSRHPRLQNHAANPAVFPKKAYGAMPPRQLLGAMAPKAAPQGIYARCCETLDSGLFFDELTRADAPLHGQIHAMIRSLQSGPVKSRRLATVGCSELAAAMALVLTQQGKKVCVLDLGEGYSQLSWMLGLKDSEPGLAELFSGDVGLEHLIVRAKTLAPIKNCYVLPKGKLPVDWLKLSDRLQTLVSVMEKKFHHVILSLPDPASNPATVRLLHELAIPRVILNTQMAPDHVARMSQALPACRMMRVH